MGPRCYDPFNWARRRGRGEGPDLALPNAQHGKGISAGDAQETEKYERGRGGTEVGSKKYGVNGPSASGEENTERQALTRVVGDGWGFKVRVERSFDCKR